MPLAVKVGFGADTIGEYRIRDGKIEVVAGSPEVRADLDRRLETYARQMDEYHGFHPETIAAEDRLPFAGGPAEMALEPGTGRMLYAGPALPAGAVALDADGVEGAVDVGEEVVLADEGGVDAEGDGGIFDFRFSIFDF